MTRVIHNRVMLMKETIDSRLPIEFRDFLQSDRTWKNSFCFWLSGWMFRIILRKVRCPWNYPKQPLSYGSSISSAFSDQQQCWKAINIRAGRLELIRFHIPSSAEENCDSEFVFCLQIPQINIYSRNSVQYLATANPERYQPLIKYYDEIFLALNAFVQNYYLRKNGEFRDLQ